MGRFFLKNGVPLVTSRLRVDTCGDVWGAAFERPLVDELVDACHAAGLELDVLAPTVSVLPRALLAETISWSDEGMAVDVRASEGHMIGVRRTCAARTVPVGAPDPVPALAALGDSGVRFADAYGAAMVGRRDVLTLRPTHSRTALPVPRRRLVAAALAFSVTSLFALTAPVISARRQSARAEHALSALAAQRRAALAATTDLRRVSTVLDDVSAFSLTRESPTLFLAALTRVLPEGAAISTLRFETTAVTLVALTPRAAGLMAGLERLSQVTAPEVIGPVTKEVVAAHEVDRVTIRMKWRRHTSAAQVLPRTLGPLAR
jgi:hypothetical protein